MFHLSVCAGVVVGTSFALTVFNIFSANTAIAMPNELGEFFFFGWDLGVAAGFGYTFDFWGSKFDG